MSLIAFTTSVTYKVARMLGEEKGECIGMACTAGILAPICFPVALGLLIVLTFNK